MTKTVSVQARPRGKTGLREFFRPNGPLARFHPQYEFRPGQLAMAGDAPQMDELRAGRMRLRAR